MKVLLDHRLPFHLAHGGLQVQIEQTMRCLRECGVDVDFVRWWDQAQSADIIHFFGRPDLPYLDYAHRKGIRIVLAELLTGLGSRSNAGRFTQRLLMAASRRFLPAAFVGRMAWDAYKHADACVALTPWEAQLMVEIFAAPENRVHVIPNGIEEVFFKTPAAPRNEWLVCTAVIDPRKRVLELASAAAHAKVPVWIIGRPYSDQDAYFQEFLKLAQAHPKWVRFEGPISDRQSLAAAYRQARGFVLLSTMESRSISAEEAAASGCPLLLSDLPWARSVFGSGATYCPITADIEPTAAALRNFYNHAPKLPGPPLPCRWSDVAKQFTELYSLVLNSA